MALATYQVYLEEEEEIALLDVVVVTNGGGQETRHHASMKMAQCMSVMAGTHSTMSSVKGWGLFPW